MQLKDQRRRAIKPFRPDSRLFGIVRYQAKWLLSRESRPTERSTDQENQG